jgi:hypothetical protein
MSCCGHGVVLIVGALIGKLTELGDAARSIKGNVQKKVVGCWLHHVKIHDSSSD